MYSTANLHIHERRKIRKILEGGENSTQCPIVLQKDIQSWPSKTNKPHLCRELNPDPQAPKSVKVRHELSSLNFSGQRKICIMFHLLPMMDPVKISNDHLQDPSSHVQPLKPSIIFLAIHDR